MSIYRRLIVAVAAMGLATSVFAADEATTTSNSTDATTTTAAPAEAATTASADATPAATTEASNTEASSTDANSAATTTEKLDVNKASVKELMKLKGLSAAKAKAIVAYRKKHGDFKSLDELREVKGFKKLNEKKFQEIQDQLTTS